MIKVEVTEDFTLEKFNELKNIIRKTKEQEGKLFIGDTFECDEKMADYLTGNNPINRAVVKVIEVIPDVKIDKEELKETIKPKRTTKRKYRKENNNS